MSLNSKSLQLVPLLSDNKDPYKEIKFIKRKAEIKDGDGNAVFSQDNVEFPESWSQNAVNIVSSKYFYGDIDSETREHSVKQLIDRVVNTIADFGLDHKYFDEKNYEIFKNEFKYMMINQLSCPNSPVLFNCGIFQKYQINNTNGFNNFYYDLKEKKVIECNNEYEHPQLAACFLYSIDDNMNSIMEANNIEGKIFRSGSGAGSNSSYIRSTKETITGGGNPMGPLASIRMRDQIASSIKSGGKCFKEGTLIHTPEGFVPIERLNIGDKVLTHSGECKIDDFFNNGIQECYKVITKDGYEVDVTKNHKFVYWNMTINEWDTKPLNKFNIGEDLYILLPQINLKNKRYIKLKIPNDPLKRSYFNIKQKKINPIFNEELGYVLGLIYGDGSVTIYKNDYTISCDFSNDIFGKKSAKEYVKFCKNIFGENPKKQAGNGNCTSYRYSSKQIYRFLEHNNIKKGRSNNLCFPSVLFECPESVICAFIGGYLDADGYVRKNSISFGSIDKEFLKKLQLLLLTIGIPSKLIQMYKEEISKRDGCYRKSFYNLYIRYSEFKIKFYNKICNHSKKLKYNFKATQKNIGIKYNDISSIYLKQFVYDKKHNNFLNCIVKNRDYVARSGLSRLLLKDVGINLINIVKKILYCVPTQIKSITPIGKFQTYDVEVKEDHLLSAGGIYTSNSRRAARMDLLNIDHPDIIDFINAKTQEENKVHALIKDGYDASFNGEAYSTIAYQNCNMSVCLNKDFIESVMNNKEFWTRGVKNKNKIDKFNARDVLKKIAKNAWECGDPGVMYLDNINTYNKCKNDGNIDTANPCAEFVFLKNTACNLLSLNLLKFKDKDNKIDIEKYKHAINLSIIAQEIIIDLASYPTKEIALNSHKYRPLGLGITNAGALIMEQGFSYDSDEARTMMGGLISIITSQAYITSANIAKIKGPFAKFNSNKNSFLQVMELHKNNNLDDLYKTKNYLFEEAKILWEQAIKLGTKYGYRNAQTSLIPPTGTISFFMDAVSTGLEPFLGLIIYKLLAGKGDGKIKIINTSISKTLYNLGYTKDITKKIIDYIYKNDTIEGCDLLKLEHLQVFDCSFRPINGKRSIHYMGHIKMMAACTKYLCGAVSKTVNLPEECTIEEIYNIYLSSWKYGLKNIAIYRNNSKKTQPLINSKNKEKKELYLTPKRRKPNKTRSAINHEFEITGHKFYITVGLYEDGSPCELFIKANKSGSTINGLLDALGIILSKALQHNIPLSQFTDKLAFIKFEPAGYTGDKQIPIAHSVIDYIFRWLAITFLEKNYEPQPLNNMNGMTKEEVIDEHIDSQVCNNCGHLANRTGSCYVCRNCGNTSSCG